MWRVNYSIFFYINITIGLYLFSRDVFASFNALVTRLLTFLGQQGLLFQQFFGLRKKNVFSIFNFSICCSNALKNHSSFLVFVAHYNTRRFLDTRDDDRVRLVTKITCYHNWKLRPALKDMKWYQKTKRMAFFHV